MGISDQVCRFVVEHTFGASIIAVIACYLVLHTLRQRRMRRDEAQFHIPNFLSGRPNSGDDTGSLGQREWLEIHPPPRRITKD